MLNKFMYSSITVHDGPSADTCIPFPRYNRTIITDVYAGIPENLLLNAIGFLVRLTYFLLLFERYVSIRKIMIYIFCKILTYSTDNKL